MKNGGLIHIYCGNGKGKTTAAMGLALRCSGYGNKVLIAQFMKSRFTGELKSLALLPHIEVLRGKESSRFTFQMTKEEKQQLLHDHLELFAQVMLKCSLEKPDLLILDEVLGACKKGVFRQELLVDFLKSKPRDLEVVLTGRDPAPELLELADYVSEICKRKHPYEQGVPAREGIER